MRSKKKNENCNKKKGTTLLHSKHTQNTLIANALQGKVKENLVDFLVVFPTLKMHLVFVRLASLVLLLKTHTKVASSLTHSQHR